MATVKISELSSSANITSDDFFPIVDSLVTKKATAATMKDFVLGRSGSNDTIHISSSDAIDLSAATGMAVNASYIDVTAKDGPIIVTSEYDLDVYVKSGSFRLVADHALNNEIYVDAGYMHFGSNGGINFTNNHIFQPLDLSSDPFLRIRAKDILISGSDNVTILGNTGISGSLTSAEGFTGSLSGTATSASYATTASYALNGGSGAGFPFTGSAEITGSLSVTGSLATNSDRIEFDGAADISGSLSVTGSFLTNASQLDFDGNMTITGSLTISGSSTFTNIGPAVFNGPISTTHPITGSISGSVSNAVSSSFAISSSRSTTSSFATTASYALNGGSGAGFPFTGSAGISGSLLLVGNQILTGSLLTNADVLVFDGTMTVSGSLITTGSVRNTQGGFTGSLFGTSSWATNATTASFALTTAGTVQNAVSASFATTASAATSITFTPPTASYAVTASYALNGGGGALTSNTTFLNIAGMTPTQTVVGTITDFGKSFILFSATTNTDIRVRLYGSASYRSNDLARPIGTNPPQNSGIITDLALSGSPALFDFTLSPVAVGTNRDPIKTPTIYYTVTNLSGTTTDVSMSFNRLVLE